MQAISDGQAALAAGRWAQARAAFETALAERETPAALAGLASALWWLGETRASVGCGERAYTGFRRAGDPIGAATAAMSLCITWSSNYGNAAAGGWPAKRGAGAGRGRPQPATGLAVLLRGYLATDPTTARELQERALGFARPAGTVTWSCAPSATWG
jgi:hypothetical protein